MLERQQEMVNLIKRRGIRDKRVLDAMRAVPRHEFVPERFSNRAYGDFPLSIGEGQTISQPYIVAMMTEALDLEPGDRVLEIGTGSGYQAAVLAEMGMEVYSIERVPELYERTHDLLDRLGYDVHMKLADGYEGWPEHTPYDGIIATAAPQDVPPPLIEQLNPEEGTLVIPVGQPYGFQNLLKLIRHGEETERRNLGGVAFVPFVTDET
jgi:protein-L-isoaspartate(D-aspartate) O-methyltransferase